MCSTRGVSFVVREAVPEDAGDIAAAHTEGWRRGYRGLIADDILDSEAFADARVEGWQAMLAGQLPDIRRAEDSIYVAVDGERAVGFGHIGLDRERPGDRSELLGFYVHPDFWGTGAAQSLIERCHLGLERFGLAAVLWVLRDNPRARAFYERNGWACGHGKDLVEDDWVGPPMTGLAEFDDPLPEVQYRRAFP